MRYFDKDTRASLVVLNQLRSLGFGFGLVHCPVRVIRRRVDRIELQHRRLRRIHYVVVRPRRNHDRIPGVYWALLLLVKNEFGLPLLDPKKLVDIRMHFIANLFTRLQQQAGRAEP